MAKILVVDDEADIRKLLVRLFEDAGYQVVTASDGKEGLEVAKAEHPDLIFLDILMPVMDGFQTCAALRSDPETKDTFIAFLTARDLPEDWDKGLQSDADMYIAKPFQPDRLLFIAKELLAMKEN
jgi:two-component system, OmpR family, alkaline phosphatase synthesis response regulator PhoP